MDSNPLQRDVIKTFENKSKTFANKSKTFQIYFANFILFYFLRINAAIKDNNTENFCE